MNRVDINLALPTNCTSDPKKQISRLPTMTEVKEERNSLRSSSFITRAKTTADQGVNSGSTRAHDGELPMLPKSVIRQSSIRKESSNEMGEICKKESSISSEQGKWGASSVQSVPKSESPRRNRLPRGASAIGPSTVKAFVGQSAVLGETRASTETLFGTRKRAATSVPKSSDGAVCKGSRRSVISFEEYLDTSAKSVVMVGRETSILKAPSMEGIMESNSKTGSDRDSDTESQKLGSSKRDVNIDADLDRLPRKPRERKIAPWNSSKTDEGESSKMEKENSDGGESNESGASSKGKSNSLRKPPSRESSMKNRYRSSSLDKKEHSLYLTGREKNDSIMGFDQESSISLAKNSDLVPNADANSPLLLDADGNNIDNELANLRIRRRASQTNSFDPRSDAVSTKIPTESSVGSSSAKPFRNNNVVAGTSSNIVAESQNYSDYQFSIRPIRTIEDNSSVRAIRKASIAPLSGQPTDSLSSFARTSAVDENSSIKAIRRRSSVAQRKYHSYSMDDSMKECSQEFFQVSNDNVLANRAFTSDIVYDDPRAFRSEIEDQSMASIIGILERNSADAMATSMLSVSGQFAHSTSIGREPQSMSASSNGGSESNADMLSIPGTGKSRGLINAEESFHSGKSRRSSTVDFSKSTTSTSLDAKAKLKSMMNTRKSLAPDTAELNALMAMAAKSSGGYRPRQFSVVKKLNESLIQPSARTGVPVLTAESRGNWKGLVLSLKWGLRCTRAGQACILKLLQKTNHVPTSPDAATMQSFISEMDFATKVQDILNVSIDKRTGDMIQNLDKILKTRIPDYGKMGETDRFHLCRIMRLEKHKKDTVLLWEEHVLTCFHIIIAGKIEIFKLNKSQKLPLAIMNGGSMIGHARAKVHGATRTACAVLATDTILLVIDKETYLNAEGSKDLLRMDVIDSRAMPLEKGCKVFVNAPSYFSKLAIFFDYHVWERGEVVQQQGNSMDYIYFLLKGSCRVTRSIPLLQKSHWEKTVLEPFSGAVDAFVPVKTKEFEEKVVFVQLQTQDSLGIGDWFPYIPIANKEPGRDPIDKEAIYRFRMLNSCEYTITAEEAVMTARIAMEDFLEIAGQQLLRVMLDNSNTIRYDLFELQDKYLQDRAWEQLKKNTVNSIVSQLKTDQKENKKTLQREGVMRAASFMK